MTHNTDTRATGADMSHNPVVLALAWIHRSARAGRLAGGRYEWGVGRGHGWLPEHAAPPCRAGLPLGVATA